MIINIINTIADCYDNSTEVCYNVIEYMCIHDISFSSGFVGDHRNCILLGLVSTVATTERLTYVGGNKHDIIGCR